MSHTPMSILVVDDDTDNASSLGELFEMEGHKVEVVFSGQAAIDAYVNHSFDLAFMDVMMPGKNGVESFLEIRRMRPSAKVYMMTGYSVEELLQQATLGGALGVLEKPFDAAEVMKLSEQVGSHGLVLSQPGHQHGEVGQAIFSAIKSFGKPCRLVSDVNALDQPVHQEETLVIDAQLPVIDGISAYNIQQKRGQMAPTFIVPPPTFKSSLGAQVNVFRDVLMTGILNKPFDPMDLLNRLPRLAA